MFKNIQLSFVFILAIYAFDVSAVTLASITADSLNVRDAPSGSVATTLPRGTIVLAVGTSGEWVKIAYQNKNNSNELMYGWVSIKFLQVISEGNREETGTPEEKAKIDRFCKVASYTFMGLIENIEAADDKFKFGKLICESRGRSDCYAASSVAKGICMVGGRSDCYAASSLGKGICMAGGRSDCYAASSVAKGICMAGGRSDCYAASSLGKGICMAGGRSDCYDASSVAKGICMAGGRSDCYAASSLGKGICMAGGGSDCYSVLSLEDGICKAAGVNCNNPSLEEALCRAAGEGDCTGITFSKMLAASVKVCGPDIFYDYEPQD